MELSTIHEFVTLVRTGKYQDAADELYLSQPTLSKHIMALERELGEPLFARAGRRAIRLTPFGQAFLPYALKLSGVYTDLRTELLDRPRGRRVVIGTSPVVPLYTVFRFFDAFLQDHGDYSIEVIDNAPEELYSLLRRGQCDLIVSRRREGDESADLVYLPYKSDRLAAVLPPDHPLADRLSVAFTELRDERFVLISGSDIPALAEKLSREAGFTIRETLTVGRAEAAIDLVAGGTGISVMPFAPAVHFSHGQAAVVPLTPEEPVDYAVVRRADLPLTPVVRDLIRYLEEDTAHSSEEV